MAIRDLIPWSRQENRLPAPVNGARESETHPLLSLHREMNRLFDDVFRGFALTNTAPLLDSKRNWPRVEIAETDDAMTISAELPGLTEKDVQVDIVDGVLSIRGERRAERSDEGRYFTERFYGSFERQIPLENVEQDKVRAEFRNGLLTVTLPKSAPPSRNVKRIAINTN